MKVTIFSSNQPRHLNLVVEMSKIADEIYFVSEVNTVFPGAVSDQHQRSSVMQTYFSNVIESERRLFGDIDFLPGNVRTLAIKSKDLSKLDRNQLGPALDSDIFVIFGASYITGWLIDFLIGRRAVNLHMGISPYFRGSACNFWALQKNKPSYVGATIHMLSKGLDNGDMLFHCVPTVKPGDTAFDFTMRSVLVAQQGLVDAIQDQQLFSLNPVPQDRSKQIHYSKKSEFTDDVAQEFLARKQAFEESHFDYPELLRPRFG